MNFKMLNRLVVMLVVAGLLIAGVFLLMDAASEVARADPGTLFASAAGTGAACTRAAPCGLQTALTQANQGDVIYVAGGTYTGTGDAVVTVTRSITLYGGWDGAAAGPVVRDPDAYPTTLDGERQRRCVFIDGGLAPVLDGFCIVGGNATNTVAYPGYGGGIFSDWSEPVIANNVVTDNVASMDVALQNGSGGGICVLHSASAVISGNLVVSNTASITDKGQGGGLYVAVGSGGLVSGNTVLSNTASSTGQHGYGGGLYVGGSSGMVRDNHIEGNRATGGEWAPWTHGGGIYVNGGGPLLEDNTVLRNTAGLGGGIRLDNTEATVRGGLLQGNRADDGGAFYMGGCTVTIEGVEVVGNSADHSGGGIYAVQYDGTVRGSTLQGNMAEEGGGIVLLMFSSATVRENEILSNTASGDGGGIAVQNSTPAIISNTIQGNIAGDVGGGISLKESGATIQGNAIQSNSASDRGGGIYSKDADPVISTNVIRDNIGCSDDAWCYGGGIYLEGASLSALVQGNQVISNAANAVGLGMGGGLSVHHGDATVQNNVFLDNLAAAGVNGMGGAIELSNSSAVIDGNVLLGNRAELTPSGFGGAIRVEFDEPTLTGNRIVSNTAEYGAVSIGYTRQFTMTNNVVAQNVGDGVVVRGSESYPLAGTLLHNTIAGNGERGVYLGYYESGYSTLTLTNNIIVSHTVGIYAYEATSGVPNQAIASYTLFYGNAANTDGSIITSTHEIVGAPLFVNQGAFNYHIRGRSAAVDAGVNAGVTVDMDGDQRPQGAGFDIGADEFVAEEEYIRVYLPVVMRE